MAILENLVDLTEITAPNDSFISDPLQVGDDGRAMFTACPQGRAVRYDIYMQVNIASTGPDGPFEEQWTYLPYLLAVNENVYRTSNVYHDIIPGAFVRMVVKLAYLDSSQEPGSLRLTLRTEAFSGE